MVSASILSQTYQTQLPVKVSSMQKLRNIFSWLSLSKPAMKKDVILIDAIVNDLATARWIYPLEPKGAAGLKLDLLP